MADLAKKADESGATKEQLAAVLSDNPETNEEQFEAAFDEIIAEDDSETAALTAPDGAVEGREDDDKAEAKPASGEESSDTDETARKSAADEKDIWADATPAQRAAYQAAQQENRSHRGRVSALDRAARAAAPKPAADKAADKPATPETDEDWEQFKTDYPEVAGPMEQRFEKRMTKLEGENADLRGQVTGITDSRLADATDAEEALLAQRHPDWEQLTTSDVFSAWLPGQPRYVQEGFARNGDAIIDGQEAASLIDLFIIHRNTLAINPEPDSKSDPTNTEKTGKATRRARRLESAVTTESGQAGPGAGPPEGDFGAAFDYFARQP